MNLTIGQRVLFDSTVLARQYVIPHWFKGKSWGTVTYVGELYTGVEIHNIKRFFEAKFKEEPGLKEKLSEMGIKEPWVIGLMPEQQQICLTVK